MTNHAKEDDKMCHQAQQIRYKIFNVSSKAYINAASKY